MSSNQDQLIGNIEAQLKELRSIAGNEGGLNDKIKAFHDKFHEIVQLLSMLKTINELDTELELAVDLNHAMEQQGRVTQAVPLD